MYDEPYDDYPQGVASDRNVKLNVEVVVEWSNAAVLSAVIERVSQLIYNEIKPTAITAISNALDDLANKAMIEMFETEIHPTDRWGKSVGQAITIREMLQRDAEKWLTESVDHSGRRGSDSYGDKLPRIHWLFQDAINGPKDYRGKTELKKMIIENVKAVVGDVTGQVEEIIKAQARKALGL